jgi:hypothetical protein
MKLKNKNWCTKDKKKRSMSIWVNIPYPWLESKDQNHYIKKKKPQFLTNSILKYEIKKKNQFWKKV